MAVIVHASMHVDVMKLWYCGVAWNCGGHGWGQIMAEVMDGMDHIVWSQSTRWHNKPEGAESITKGWLK